MHSAYSQAVSICVCAGGADASRCPGVGVAVGTTLGGLEVERLKGELEIFSQEAGAQEAGRRSGVRPTAVGAEDRDCRAEKALAGRLGPVGLPPGRLYDHPKPKPQGVRGDHRRAAQRSWSQILQTPGVAGCLVLVLLGFRAEHDPKTAPLLKEYPYIILF